MQTAMSFIYEKSRTWRIIVAVTKHSKLAMVGFAAVCVGGTYGMAKLAMNATNPEMKDEALQKMLKKKPSLHQQVNPLLITNGKQQFQDICRRLHLYV